MTVPLRPDGRASLDLNDPAMLSGWTMKTQGPFRPFCTAMDGTVTALLSVRTATRALTSWPGQSARSSLSNSAILIGPLLVSTSVDYRQLAVRQMPRTSRVCAETGRCAWPVPPQDRAVRPAAGELPARTNSTRISPPAPNVFEGETRIRTFPGEMRSVLVAARFPPGPHRFDRVLVSLMDIAERNKVQRALEDARADLAHYLARDHAGRTDGLDCP